MLFNSFRFIFLFLPAVLGVARVLRGQNLLRWITFVSLLFYAWAGHVWFLIPMIITTTLDFYLAPLVEQSSSLRRRKLFLWVSLVGNLGFLIYFKYAGLFLHSAQLVAYYLGYGAAAPGWLSYFDVILPAGISFYTFQTLSYMIDVYRGHAHAERNFWKFAGFVCFFPHLVAGPLTRHNQLLPQLQKIKNQGIEPQWEEGITLFLIGLIKKVLIADRISVLIDPLIEALPGITPWAARLALLGYTLQIYFDFSGYSDMAIGLGRLFGIELPQNFDRPYQAVSPRDFWQRWHITLSRWLRDYLYISLGGNRCSASRKNFNLFITMLLGGLWHGAHWNFAIWGFYQGLLLYLYHQCADTWDQAPKFFKRATTFVLIAIGWAFFRSSSLWQALSWLGLIFKASSSPVSASVPPVLPVFLAAALLYINLEPNFSLPGRLKASSGTLQFAVGLLTIGAVLYMSASSRFLYFQF